MKLSFCEVTHEILPHHTFKAVEVVLGVRESDLTPDSKIEMALVAAPKKKMSDRVRRKKADPLEGEVLGLTLKRMPILEEEVCEIERCERNERRTISLWTLPS